MSKADLKKWIDNASYEDLLRRNRFGELDDNIFRGGVGDYFVEKMSEKKRALPEGEHTRISKRIGWDAP